MQRRKRQIKDEIPLDNASSVVVAFRSRRKRRKMVHRYTVRYGGVEVQCDSPQAAARLIRELRKQPDHPSFVHWTVDEFGDFTDRLQLYPRRLLAFLLTRSTMTDDDLRQHLNIVGNKALAGVLSGISKVALALDIDPARVYCQHTSYSQGKPVRRYWATPAFQKAAQDLDWPSKSDLRTPVEEEDGKAPD